MTFPKYPFTGQEYEEYRDGKDYAQKIERVLQRLKQISRSYDTLTMPANFFVKTGIELSYDVIMREFKGLIK